jgi:hypothetical protein
LDDEITETFYENHFQHQEEIIETSCHDTQELASPLAKNETN